MNPPYGLIFDVDGVIADTEAVNARASIAVFSEMFGIENVVRDDFRLGLGRGAAEYILAAARVHGAELTPEQIELATAARQERFLAILQDEPLPPLPGVLELMDEARRHADVGVGIATSSTREKSQAVLEAAGIPYRQVVYITGSDVQHKKPHPELFLTAARRMSVPPAQCVVVEDAPNGVEAAHRAGCQCVAVTNSAPADELAAADRIVDSLSELTLGELIGLAARR